MLARDLCHEERVTLQRLRDAVELPSTAVAEKSGSAYSGSDAPSGAAVPHALTSPQVSQQYCAGRPKKRVFMFEDDSD